jgi:GDP-mannose transporter
LMVLSSGIAAYADVKTPAQPTGAASDGGFLSMFNAGYVWMGLNCICNAVFVLAMKVRIKVTNFKDFDSK